MLNLVRGRPLLTQYAITHRCNSRCESCAYWAKGTTDELGITEISRLADELWDFGVRIVTITGGEPFMRKDAVDIIRLFFERGFRVTINTNGTLLDPALIGRLSDIGKLHIVVSLDSLDRKTYLRLRGVDSFKKVLETLSYLKRHTPHKIRLFTIVTSYNYREVPEIFSFCRENGFMLSLYPIMSSYRGRWFTPHQMIRSEADRKKITALFDDLAERSKRDRTLFGFSTLYRGAARYLRGEQTGKCGAGEMSLQVSPEGKVSACPEMEPFCDIRRERLKVAYQRRDWHKTVEGCSIKTPCYIGCTRMLQSIRNTPLRFVAETAFKFMR